MAEFVDQDLRDSRFERVDLRGARINASDLRGSRFRGNAMHGVTMRGVELVDVDIDGEVVNLTINGVEVGALSKPSSTGALPTGEDAPDGPGRLPRGLGPARAALGQTVERARRLDPDLLHQSVDEEWSFIETLRHLVFATDAWFRRAILGDPSPWHPLDLPWDEMTPAPGVPWDRSVRPSLDTVLELRRDRTSGVRAFLEELTEEQLDDHTDPVEGPGWPPPVSFEVRECLLIILSEEWEHRRYAERDLAALENRGRAGGAPDGHEPSGAAC